MSLWRKEASTRLPELQRLIASREVDDPMMLWVELHMKFKTLCEAEPLQSDLIKRIWGYAKWCLGSGSDEVANAAAVAFCEHLLDGKATQRILPQIMTRKDYEELKNILCYHNSEEEFAEGLKLFDARK